jgi:outer membrane protein assembly factor BamD (BamD/ComL family)
MRNLPRTAQTAARAESTAGTLQVESAGQLSEIELLRRARNALTNRPREAFALTEQHRQQYPSGMFAQERDALAIEALMRSGDMATARSLAERFVREHPNSAHAHRFREAMGIR